MINSESKGEIVIYKNEDGNISFEAKLEDDTIWLTQDMMAKLFETTIPNINMHIKNSIFIGDYKIIFLKKD